MFGSQNEGMLVVFGSQVEGGCSVWQSDGERIELFGCHVEGGFKCLAVR